VIYEHVRVSDGGVETAGEHVMSRVGPLYVRRNFFGADEAITNYHPGRRQWAATLIFSGRCREAVAARRADTLKQIRRKARSPEDFTSRPEDDMRRRSGEVYG
jgi:pyrrolysine biosynthesis protein PylC